MQIIGVLIIFWLIYIYINMIQKDKKKSNVVLSTENLDYAFKIGDGKLSIKFYEEDEVSVYYSPLEKDPMTIALNFLSYEDEICNRLGQDLSPKGLFEEMERKNPSPYMMLHSVLRNIFSEPLKKGQNILKGSVNNVTYSIKKINPKKGYYLLYEASFYDRRPIKLRTYIKKGLSYYGPMSVLAFLQHIIDNLSQEKLDEFYNILPQSKHKKDNSLKD